MRIAKLLLISMSAGLFPSLIWAQNSWACGSAPLVPVVKTIWDTTGGPTFVLTPAKTGDLPNLIYYAYAIKEVGKKTWEPWASWVQNSVSTQATEIKYVAPMAEENEQITFSAYAYNNCGGSGQNQIYRKLVTSDQLINTKLNIAEDLPLSVGSIKNYFLSPQAVDLPQTITSKNPEICAFDQDSNSLKLISAGLCAITISQNNGVLQTPNPDVTHTLNVLPNPKILPDFEKDRPDDISGFQIHVVYVKVKDSISHNYYQVGEISKWLDLSNAWLKRKIGKEFIFDTYQGAYDVSTMTSKYSTEELDLDYGAKSKSKNSKGSLEKLGDEFKAQNGADLPGKNLLFIVDAKLSDEYCGFADRPGNLALITPGSDTCWNPEFGYLSQISKFNGPSAAIAHELIHNLGVKHVCEDKSDLMIGDGCELSKVGLETTIDSQNKQYLKASKAGANILDLKVWKDGSGLRHLAFKDVCFLSEPCLVSEGYWTTSQGNLQIQEKIAGKWRSIGTFKMKKISNKRYTFIASILPSAKGIHTYREYIPATKNYLAYFGQPIKKNVI